MAPNITNLREKPFERALGQLGYVLWLMRAMISWLREFVCEFLFIAVWLISFWNLNSHSILMYNVTWAVVYYSSLHERWGNYGGYLLNSRLSKLQASGWIAPIEASDVFLAGRCPVDFHGVLLRDLLILFKQTKFEKSVFLHLSIHFLPLIQFRVAAGLDLIPAATGRDSCLFRMSYIGKLAAEEI